MAGTKDHTDISPDNILKPAVESLTTDEQQQYKDYMRQAKEKFLSQYTVDDKRSYDCLLSTSVLQDQDIKQLSMLLQTLILSQQRSGQTFCL